jgi:DnaK suppressor protein
VPEAPAVEVRSRLEEERKELQARLTELGVGEGIGLHYDSNFADTSQVTAERGEAEALSARLAETLTDVERAIGKLEDGTFGSCEDCGDPINETRLEAMPAARFCIGCAAKH